MTAVRVRRGGENTGAVASPRFFAAPPRSTSSTTYCGVLPPSWRSLSLVARKMFSRDTPRQPEKRSRFLVGQCQPIFPSTTIFLALLLLLLRFFANRQINATNGAVISSVFLSSYSPSTRPVPLFRSTARTCRCKWGENRALDSRAREKSSSHDRRTLENSILSGLAESRGSPNSDLHAVLCTYTLPFPPLFLSLSLSPSPLNCTLSVCCPYCKWYTMETRTARVPVVTGATSIFL